MTHRAGGLGRINTHVSPLPYWHPSYSIQKRLLHLTFGDEGAALRDLNFPEWRVASKVASASFSKVKGFQ